MPRRIATISGLIKIAIQTTTKNEICFFLNGKRLTQRINKDVYYYNKLFQVSLEKASNDGG